MKPYKRYFSKQQEELTSSDIPQDVRPENIKKVVKIGSIAKVDLEDEEDSIEEDLLKSKKDRKDILDNDKKELLLKQKNKSISNA